jgi:hypothetical protein
MIEVKRTISKKGERHGNWRTDGSEPNLMYRLEFQRVPFARSKTYLTVRL